MIMKCERVSCMASAGAPTVFQHAGQTSPTPIFYPDFEAFHAFHSLLGRWLLTYSVCHEMLSDSLVSFMASHFNFRLPQCG